MEIPGEGEPMLPPHRKVLLDNDQPSPSKMPVGL